MIHLKKLVLATTAMGLLTPVLALAAVSAEQAAELGKSLTPMGAEAAANADGSIPAYEGKWLGAPPTVNYDGRFNPDPYADEKPLFSITADNLKNYADKLGEGQKALFAKYPKTYRIDVYPTHRDFRHSDEVNAHVRQNATAAELSNDGLTLKGAYGGVAFPIPQSGIELVYNILTTNAPWMVEAPNVSAYVQSSGAIAWIRNTLRAYNTYHRGNDRAGWNDGISAYAITNQKAPPREAGKGTFTVNSYDFVGYPRQSWQYDPGTRRLRKTPDVGFDYPMDSGPRVVDEQNGLNGSPERFDWQLIGKKEVYVPFNTFKLEDRALKYKDVTATRGHPNPDVLRYELRRVWVVEGTLKKGIRHVYGKRRFYVEEDSWQVAMADNYDVRGQLWRVTENGIAYAYDAKVHYLNASFYQDLVSGAYSAENITSEEPTAAQFNRREPLPNEFTPAGMRSSGL